MVISGVFVLVLASRNKREYVAWLHPVITCFRGNMVLRNHLKEGRDLFSDSIILNADESSSMLFSLGFFRNGCKPRDLEI